MEPEIAENASRKREPDLPGVGPLGTDPDPQNMGKQGTKKAGAQKKIPQFGLWASVRHQETPNFAAAPTPAVDKRGRVHARNAAQLRIWADCTC